MVATNLLIQLNRFLVSSVRCVAIRIVTVDVPDVPSATGLASYGSDIPVKLERPLEGCARSVVVRALFRKFPQPLDAVGFAEYIPKLAMEQ